MVLATPWSTLPMMLKLLVVGMCPVCWMCTCMGEGCLSCFLYLSSQVSWCFPYIFFTAGNVPTLIAVYYTTLLILRVLVLRCQEKLFDCCISPEVSLYSIITTYLLKAFWYSFGSFNTPGLKLDSFQHQSHLHNNGQAQINTANNQLLVAIGHSVHSLNSDHVLREF